MLPRQRARHILILLVALTLLPRPALGWERDLVADGDDPSPWDSPPWTGGVNATTFDAAGDVIVAGGGFTGGATPGFVAKLSGIDGRELWRRAIVGTAGGGTVHGVLADGTDVYVVGQVRNVGTHDDVLAMKLSGADGLELWRNEIDGSAPIEPGAGTYQQDRGVSVAIGADGDPVFAANVYHWQESTNVLVIKLARATGAELWRTEIDGGGGGADHLEQFEAFAVATDGDLVFTAGLVGVTGADLGIVRLAGATGNERWRYLANFGAYGIAVTIDQSGDIVATGGGPTGGGGVVKVDASGNELWQYVWGASGDYGVCLTTDGAGDVLIGGVDGMFAVLKLDGGDGSLLWTYRTLGSFPWDLGVDPAGDIVAAGGLSGSGEGQFGVVHIAGANGAETWRYERPDQGPGEARAVFLDADGRAIVGGYVAESAVADRRAFVLRVAPEIAGKALAANDSAAASSKRVLKFRSQPSALVVPTLGGPADPTLTGATLDLYNPVTGEHATVSLPAAQWLPVGRSPSLRYRFKGTAADACQKVGVSEGTVMVACKGSGLGFSLDEPTQGALGVRLTLGTTPGISYCSVFGGNVTRDAGTLPGGKGAFKAKSAPAPGSCAVP